MVYKYQEEGVLFDNVRSASSFLSGLPLGNDKVYNDAQDGDYVTRKYSIRDIGSVVNALDIDWNGAHINNIEDYNIEILNTTSDLLKWIKHLEYRISILENNGSRPGDSEEYSTITWDDNGATSPHSGGSTTTVRNGSPIIIPTTDPKREYTITWNANGGTGVSGGSDKATYGFKGWYTSRLGGSPLVSNTIANGDATYYALWNDPSEIILPTTNPTRNGYNFMGWATTSSATTPDVTSSTVPTDDVTYYAVWLIQSATLSSIRWENTTATSVLGSNPNWPRIICSYSDGLISYINVNTNGVTTSKSITSSTAAGTYSNITATYQGKTTTNSLTYIVTALPVTQYTVTYHSNGGNSTPEPQIVNSGETVTLAGAISRNADSSYTYKFNHWNTNSSNTGTSYNAGQTITVNNNIDLYAQWNKTEIPVTPTTEYYWYVGKDESLLGKNGTSYNLNLSLLPTVNSIDEIYTNSQNVGSENNNIYVVCPTEWVGHFELRGLDDNRLLYTDKTSQITSGVTGYSILRGTAASTVSIIKITLQ